MTRIINYQNKKFHHLTLISRARAGGRGVGAIWNALCDCGEMVEVEARQVAYGRRKTCGKCLLGRDLARVGRMRSDRTTKRERQAYSRYFRTAARRYKKFTIEPAQFIELIHRNCSYCGAGPNQSEQGLNEITLVLDKGDYTPENTDTICKRCRGYKQDSNQADFLNFCIEVALHISSQSEST